MIKIPLPPLPRSLGKPPIEGRYLELANKGQWRLCDILGQEVRMLNSAENRLVSAAYAPAVLQAKAERERDAAREAMRLMQAELETHVPSACARDLRTLQADAAKWKAEAKSLRQFQRVLLSWYGFVALASCTLGVLIGYGLARGLV